MKQEGSHIQQKEPKKKELLEIQNYASRSEKPKSLEGTFEESHKVEQRERTRKLEDPSGNPTSEQ